MDPDLLVEPSSAARMELLRLTLDLKRLPLFQAIPTDQLVTVAETVVRVPFRRGDDLGRQGDEANRLLVIERGRLEVRVDDRRVATLGPGDLAGEAVLLEHPVHPATLRGLEDGNCFALMRVDVHELLDVYPEIARTAVDLVIERIRAQLASDPNH